MSLANREEPYEDGHSQSKTENGQRLKEVKDL